VDVDASAAPRDLDSSGGGKSAGSVTDERHEPAEAVVAPEHAGDLGRADRLARTTEGEEVQDRSLGINGIDRTAFHARSVRTIRIRPRSDAGAALPLSSTGELRIAEPRRPRRVRRPRSP
jgi:hypothetical protein